MPNLRLRIRQGEIIGKLPGRCLFCNKRVLDLRVRVLQTGGQQFLLHLPLCDEDRKEGRLYLDNPRGSKGAAMDAAVSRIPIAWIFWNLFKLFSWGSKPRRERNDQFVVITDVCPEFLDAFEDMNDRAREEEEEDVEAEESRNERASKRRRTPSQGGSPLPWILAGVGTMAILFMCCGGAAVVGVIRQRARQQQSMANRPVQPFPAPVVMPPPAKDGGDVRRPRPPVKQPPQAEGAKDAPGEIMPVLEGHTGNVVSLTYAQNGNVLISAAEDGTVRWWRIDEGNPPQQTQFRAAPGKLSGLALSPDGKRVPVTARKGNVQLLDGAGGGLLETLETQTGKVALGLAFTQDSKTLLTGHFNHDIKVWDVESHKLRTTLKGGNDWTMAIAFSPDGKRFATTGGLEYSITLWDAATQKSIGKLNGHNAGGRGSVRWLAFAPDSKTLASAADDGTARLWDVTKQQERFAMVHPEKQVNGVAFTPDGALLVTGCKDGQLRIWDTATGRQRGGTDLPASPFTPGVTAIALSPDGKLIATGNGRLIRRWSLAQLLK